LPRPEPKKILFCIDALASGGTELQLTGLIDNLDRSRFKPHLLTIRPSPPELTPEDCPHLAWHVPRLMSPGGVYNILRLKNYLQQEKFQVVQTFFQDSTVLGGVAARLAGVPTRLACFRDLGFWRTPIQKVLLHRVYPMMTGFLCNAEVVKKNFVEHDGICSDDIEVIYNGINVAGLPWVEHFGPTLHVGIVGNLNRRVKRTDLFVKAAAMIAGTEEGRAITWHIIGDGQLRDEYEKLIRAEGLSSRVVFAGRIKDVAGYLEKIDIGVICSDSEGFSNALLEYMLKGCACVATDVGGNAEAVDSGHTGLLVPPDDAPALAAALESLISDVALRQTLAKQARSYASTNFNWQKCTAAHEALYCGK
jgi:glycosyltransferase involved in cell wall biosynthesis